MVTKEITSEVKKKKKKWIKIIAPIEFNDVEIGESLVEGTNNLLNRKVTANLTSLTGDMKKQNVKIKFIIKKAEEDKVVADTYGYQLVQSYARRVMGSAESRVEDSFICTTNDSINLRVKPLILIKHKIKKSILKLIRKNTKSILVDQIKKQNYKEFIDSLVTYKLQREMKSRLNKIYPVSLFEIRILERLEK